MRARVRRVVDCKRLLVVAFVCWCFGLEVERAHGAVPVRTVVVFERTWTAPGVADGRCEGVTHARRRRRDRVQELARWERLGDQTLRVRYRYKEERA